MQPDALLIGRIRVHDAALWADYCRQVPQTLEPWGATIVARGAAPVVLAGASDDSDVVVIRFSSREAIERWYASAAYQALIPLRDAAARVTIVGYEAA